jgi:hypothetical protein
VCKRMLQMEEVQMHFEVVCRKVLSTWKM